MADKQRIKQRTGDPVTDLALDAITNDKQLIVFVNTKRSAEACAERIAKAVNANLPVGQRPQLSDDIRSVLTSPTKQCHRLADSVKHQAAFHHSGLHSEQRTLVENAFKTSTISAICATPTLAAGLDMPAYRVIIRDLQRFSGGWGMKPIPVLEYEQMSGRAGRPGYDDEGQAITIADNQEERDEITLNYINADPEPIQSKLAARPVLRTYALSLVATGYVGTMDELESFMKETFYGHQYGDDQKLLTTLRNVKDRLTSWEMIKGDNEPQGFVSAKELKTQDDLEATELGERVSELYLDPYTANNLVERLDNASDEPSAFAILHMIAYTLEMRPLIRTKKGDKQAVESTALQHEKEFLVDPPGQFEDGYDEYLNSVKTAAVLHDWIEEVTEDRIEDKYGVTPGQLQAKRSLADWLLYSCDELCDVLDRRDLASTIRRVKKRVNLGVADELLKLTRFDNIGRVRARRLHDNGVQTTADIKNTAYESLQDILGKKTAASLKKQVGEAIDPDAVDDDNHGNLLDFA